MNYQLTNDLIKDITTLLQDPENRKIVNEGQPYFGVGTMVGYKQGELAFRLNIEDVPFAFDDLSEGDKLFIIRHCIKLLPAFQDKIKNDYILIKYQDIKTLSEHGYDCELVTTPGRFKLEVSCHPYYEPTGSDQTIANYIKDTTTLSQALLKSGAMTVSELESEYKRLTKTD